MYVVSYLRRFSEILHEYVVVRTLLVISWNTMQYQNQFNFTRLPGSSSMDGLFASTMTSARQVTASTAISPRRPTVCFDMEDGILSELR